MTNTDPVGDLANVLKSMDAIEGSRRKPNIWTLAERVRWINMAIASTRLDVQRQKGELDILRARVERLARQVGRDFDHDHDDV